MQRFVSKRPPVAPSPSERRIATAPRADRTERVSRSEEDDARASSKHRAALEALFAPKKPAEPEPTPTPDRASVKMVTVPVAREADPRAAEREKRLAKLLAAEGRAAVTKAADDFTAAGFPIPAEQDVLLKLLDHADEERVRDALIALNAVLADEPPKRSALLEARLRRLEDHAEDKDARDLASSLRRKVIAATSSLTSPR